MRRSLSTLACPDWDLPRLRTACTEHGYDGIDLRGYLSDVDVTTARPFADRPAEVRATLDAAGLEVTCLGTSISLCAADERAANLAEARRYVDLADALDVDRLRVFGVGDADRHSREELATVAGETMDGILDIGGAREFDWLVETHDNWTSVTECERLLDHLPECHTGLIWDAAHTMRLAGESPATTLDALGDRIEHVHLKDAIHDPDHEDAMDDGWRYVLPGEGDLALDDAVAELRRREYDGWVVFEHEKRWHPKLADPEVSVPAFAAWHRAVTG